MLKLIRGAENKNNNDGGQDTFLNNKLKINHNEEDVSDTSSSKTDKSSTHKDIPYNSDILKSGGSNEVKSNYEIKHPYLRSPRQTKLYEQKTSEMEHPENKNLNSFADRKLDGTLDSLENKLNGKSDRNR